MKYLIIFVLTTTFFITFSSCGNNVKLAGRLNNGAELIIQKNSNGLWGLAIENAGLSSMYQPNPVKVEWYADSNNIAVHSGGYTSVKKKSNGFTGTAQLLVNDVVFNVIDKWGLEGNEIIISRKLTVKGNGSGGFLSAITFMLEQSEEKARYFAPGMMYGNADHITPVAIGGHEGGDHTWIREDRLPAPMFGVFASDGSSVTILNPVPKGHTTRADSRDREVVTMVDKRFRFGSMGAEKTEKGLITGYKFPGTEGESTYRGFYYPDGQVKQWRQRYHPVEDGFEQEFTVMFRLENDESFSSYYYRAWRWAWDELNPGVNFQDIDLARRSLVGMLAGRVETHNGITGIPNATRFATAINNIYPSGRKTIMGFAGKTLESAEFLIRSAEDAPGETGMRHRELGLAIIQTYMQLKMDPPAGIGFWFDTGDPAPGRDDLLYLRYFGDGLKSILRLAQWEHQHGRDHEDWIVWARSFANWLIPQQTLVGGFPRAWEPGTGKVADPSPNSSYNVIPFLVLLSELTNDPTYLDAAIKAGEFCWSVGQDEGNFIGGTIDNPDVIDKEAGTLSLEAYLALYDATKDSKWLERAVAAANFSETWMYIWDVPMPDDEEDEDLHWKKGVSTTGLQLISTGHSLVDAYMAFDVDEFARLYLLTGDAHYKQVASILLHNTKGMLALPGRTYDFPGIGWQQEHWSLAPERGLGRHRVWLPWVTTSHLNGIYGLMDLDHDLYKELTRVQ